MNSGLCKLISLILYYFIKNQKMSRKFILYFINYTLFNIHQIYMKESVSKIFLLVVHELFNSKLESQLIEYLFNLYINKLIPILK